MVAKRSAAGKAKGWASDGGATPRRLAVTLAEAVELLQVPLRDIQRAAREVQPYIAAGGVEKWPIRELARVLADCGGVVPPDYPADPIPERDRERRRRHRERTRG